MSQWVIVSATTASREAFETETSLGRSLRRWERIREDWTADIAFENRDGLPAVYNRALERHEKAGCPRLLFAHDDVYLNDLFLFDKLEEGFRQFDLVGIAGSTCLDLDRPNVGWCECPPECRAGGVMHPLADRREGEFYHIGFGPAPRECVVVDGVLMAVNLRAVAGVRFDERFLFDFYDLDFCLSVRARGGKVGVMPILVTHLSIGAGFGGERFRRAQEVFLEKHGSRADHGPEGRGLLPRRWLDRMRRSRPRRGQIRLDSERPSS